MLQKRNISGFTLIEIIVSLAVIGILCAVVIVSYGSWREKTTITQIKSDLLNVSVAFENYKNSNNTYPTDISKISNFKSSSSITITGGSSNGKYFCVNASSLISGAVTYHISSQDKGVQPGNCPSHNWKSVAASEQHTCAISSDDQPYCWGANDEGQIGDDSYDYDYNPVATYQGDMPSLKVKSLVAGRYYTCAINFNNRAYCWGANGDGELGDGTTDSRFVPTSVQQGAMPSLDIKSITAGETHTCAIGMDDHAYCWGSNYRGQLGNDSTNDSPVPVAVSQGAMAFLGVKSISAGEAQTCVIAFDDKIYCWGRNNLGQLGNGTTTQSQVPVLVSLGAMTSQSAKFVVTGYWTTCAIAFDDKAYCWGDNNKGQLGNNSTTQSLIPIAVLPGAMTEQKVKSIALGMHQNTTCAVSIDGKSYCWGCNWYGELGNNSAVDSWVPVAVQNGDMPSMSTSSITVGFDYTCLVHSNGDIYCFGINEQKQLGLGYDMSFDRPRKSGQGFMPFLSVKSMYAGIQNTCAINIDDKMYCWGNNYSGRLGNNAIGGLNFSPIAVNQGAMPSLTVKKMDTGDYHGCSISINDRAYCWGNNSNGQLGNNSTVQASIPVAVNQGAMASLSVKSISAGQHHTCAVGFDDKGYCWGANTYGQLGNNSTTRSLTPVAVLVGGMPSQIIKSISAGDYSTCAIASDDKIYCWGANTYGQLGNNSTTRSLTPVAVLAGAMPSQVVKFVTVGPSRVCAIGSDDKAYCWGSNNRGQLGDNTYTQKLTPTAVLQGDMPSQVVRSISTSSQHTCAIGYDGKAYCWGYNFNAELGNGNRDLAKVPSAVSIGEMPSLVIKSISAGYYHTCAIGVDDRIYCWGINADGELGISDHTRSSSYVPRLTMPPTVN